MSKFQPDNSRFELSGERPTLDSRPQDLSATKRESKRPLAVVGSLAALAVVGGVVALGLTMGGETPAPVDKVVPTQAQPQPTVNEEWYNGPDVETVIDVPEWATTDVFAAPPLVDSPEMTKEVKREWGNMVTYGKVDTSYPPDEITVTDPDQAYDGLGLPNPEYSFITDRIFMNSLHIITQQFLNPIAGGWVEYQYGDSSASSAFNPAPLSEVLAPEYLARVEKAGDKSFFPVMADWNGNNYGRDDLVPSGPRWFGEVKSSDIRLDWNERLLNYDAYVTMNVEYTSWTVDKKKVTREGVLKLKLVANTLGAQSETAMRLHVADGSLDLK